MNTKSLIFAALFAVSAPFGNVYANTLNNDTLHTEPHPKPVVSEQDPGATDAFALEDGETLSVTRNIFADVRIWKFTVGDAYWWVTDKGIIWGANTMGSMPSASSDEEAYTLYQGLP